MNFYSKLKKKRIQVDFSGFNPQLNECTLMPHSNIIRLLHGYLLIQQIVVDEIVNIAEGSIASMYSYEAGLEPKFTPASGAVDGFIPTTTGECTETIDN